MKKSIIYLMTLVIVLIAFPHISFAKTGWVSDMLLLTFRQGPGNTYTVIKTLTSNTAVTVLDEKDGFYQVELQSKEVGWVDKKFIIFDPPKEILLEQSKREKAALENQLKKLTSDIQAQKELMSSNQQQYSDQLTPLKESLEKATQENSQLKKDLAEAQNKYNTLIKQSKNVQQIVKENETLSKENKNLSEELTQVKAKNRNMFKTAMIKWVLTGVGILLLGWIFGQVISTKKRRYGSLLD